MFDGHKLQSWIGKTLPLNYSCFVWEFRLTRVLTRDGSLGVRGKMRVNCTTFMYDRMSKCDNYIENVDRPLDSVIIESGRRMLGVPG
jgi:hypothetical protein